MGKLSVFIRADGGGPRIGLGHLMRTLSLAEALTTKECYIEFLCKDYPIGLTILNERHYPFNTIPSALDHEQDLFLTQEITKEGNLLILDGYEWKGHSLQELCINSKLVICFDDLLNRNLPIDVVIGNAYSSRETFGDKLPLFTELITGPSFIPLRKEFQDLPIRHIKREIKDILLSFGGEDPDNVTTEVLKLLQDFVQIFSIHILIGPSFRHHTLLEKAIAASKHTCTLYSNLKETVPLLNKMDIVISAGGTSIWEFAASGLPMILTPIVDNQIKPIEFCKDKKIALTFEKNSSKSLKIAFELMTFETRQEMSFKAQALIDGQGAERLANELLSIFSKKILLRKPSKDPLSFESLLLWDWRNDILTKEMSKNSEAIDWEKHREWYSQMIADPRQHLFIAYQAGRPIGTARLSLLENNSALVSINMNPCLRKMGLGQLLLEQVCNYGFQILKVKELIAEIKKENHASIKIFSRIGFHNMQEDPGEFLKFIMHEDSIKSLRKADKYRD